MPKQVIDITTPEENPEVVLVSSKPKKPIKKRVKKATSIKTFADVKTLADKSKGKEKIRISFSFALPRIVIKLPLIIGAVVIVLGGVFLYLTLQAKAIVSVKPVLEPIKIEEEIKVSFSQNQMDQERKIIPGQIIAKEVEKWSTFKATGKETEQSGAAGTIFVYNGLNPPVQLTLKEGTRFLSSKDGKIYKAKEKVVLPAATLKDGKISPSITTVQVIAQQEGEEYNIAPAKFSVPGLAGTASYYSVWGESKQKIEGGSQKDVIVVSQGDLDQANEAINKDLHEMALSGLLGQTGQGFVLNQESISFSEPEISCSQETGAKVLEFNCYAKIKAIAMIFKDQDLKEMAKWFISQKISSEKTLHEDSLMTTVIPKGKLTEGNDLFLGLKTEAKFYNNIDKQSLINSIASKNQEEIRLLIANNYPQIEKIGLEFWPFWIKKVPKNLEKIQLELSFQ